MSFVGKQTIGKIMHESFWKRTGSYQPFQYQFLSSTLLRLSTLTNSTNETGSDTRSHVLSREWICTWSRGTHSTTSGWSIIVFPTKVQLILEVWRYYTLYLHSNTNCTTWILSTETLSILPLLVCCMGSTVTIWRPPVVSLYRMAIVHQVLLTNPTSNYISQKKTHAWLCVHATVIRKLRANTSMLLREKRSNCDIYLQPHFTLTYQIANYLFGIQQGWTNFDSNTNHDRNQMVLTKGNNVSAGSNWKYMWHQSRIVLFPRLLTFINLSLPTNK